MLHEIAAEEFESLIGQTVVLERDGDRIEMEVDKVQRLSSPSPRLLPSFIATLREVGATRSYTQGIYRLIHPQRGAIDLFIVPSGPDGSGMSYELTFN